MELEVRGCTLSVEGSQVLACGGISKHVISRSLSGAQALACGVLFFEVICRNSDYIALKFLLRAHMFWFGVHPFRMCRELCVV